MNPKRWIKKETRVNRKRSELIRWPERLEMRTTARMVKSEVDNAIIASVQMLGGKILIN